MSRFLILVLIIVGFAKTTPVFAQQINDDIIKIKNGPTIYGGLDSIRRDTVFFRVNGKIPVTYPISQIEEFKKNDKYNYNYSNKEKSIKNKSTNLNQSARPDSSNMYYAISTGLSFFRAISPKITLGYRLHPAFIPIASIDYTLYNEAPGRFTGLTAGITGSSLNNVIRPYYSLQLGYGMNNTPSDVWGQGELLNKTGGIKMDIGAGIIKPIIDANNLVTIGLNYGTQQATYQYNSSIWNWTLNRMENVVFNEKIRYNRLYFTLGIIF